MSEPKDTIELLELMSQPAFCVRDGTITRVNLAAKRYLLEPGTPVAPLLGDSADEYAHFQRGCLFLTVTLEYHIFAATVSPLNDEHVFVLHCEDDQPILRALSLAAQELRNPMSDLMAITERLLPELEHTGDDSTQSQVTHLNRSLYQILRVVSNMSDAAQYTAFSLQRQSYREIGSIVDELMENAASLVEQTPFRFHYQGLAEPVYTMVDEEQLERALLNMLSNAMKFTKKDSTIHVRMTRRDNRLYFSVQDEGEGVPSDILGHMHHRYQRSPGLEDPRQGLGLGMTMIRACAAAHGGSVLVTHPKGGGAQVTMTLAIRECRSSTLRNEVLRPDYAGERNHCLLELSECLPAELYSPKLL